MTRTPSAGQLRGADERQHLGCRWRSGESSVHPWRDRVWLLVLPLKMSVHSLFHAAVLGRTSFAQVLLLTGSVAGRQRRECSSSKRSRGTGRRCSSKSSGVANALGPCSIQSMTCVVAEAVYSQQRWQVLTDFSETAYKSQGGKGH